MFDLIKEDLQTIYEKDSSAESRLEVALCYPGFHALQFHRAAHWCYIQGWTTTARVVSSLGRFFTGVDIHPAAKIGRRVFIDHGMGVVIGNTVQIGDDCTIYQGATIGGTDIGKENAKLTIKNNVVIGAGAQILGGVTVGENAQIGPSAVVLKSLGDGVSVGLPNHVTHSGREVRSLGFDPEDVKKLQKLVREQAQVIARLKAQTGSVTEKDAKTQADGQDSSEVVSTALVKKKSSKKGATIEKSPMSEQVLNKTPAAQGKKTRRAGVGIKKVAGKTSEKVVSKTRAKSASKAKTVGTRKVAATKVSDKPETTRKVTAKSKSPLAGEK
ncbi:MAG TPA: hypothetical protein DD376_00425 [Sutterella sp.]|nr:hypothetical protein [Sutterella sp.]